MARGVGTPMAFIRCCIVGLGPGPLAAGDWTCCCCCCLSGDNGSGVWLRDWDTSIPLFRQITIIQEIHWFMFLCLSNHIYCISVRETPLTEYKYVILFNKHYFMIYETSSSEISILLVFNGTHRFITMNTRTCHQTLFIAT
jgi:hypothetical protein